MRDGSPSFERIALTCVLTVDREMPSSRATCLLASPLATRRRISVSRCRGLMPATLQGHLGGVWGVALDKDSALVASGGDDGTVRLWDVQERHLAQDTAARTTL